MGGGGLQGPLTLLMDERAAGQESIGESHPAMRIRPKRDYESL